MSSFKTETILKTAGCGKYVISKTHLNISPVQLPLKQLILTD